MYILISYIPFSSFITQLQFPFVLFLKFVLMHLLFSFPCTSLFKLPLLFLWITTKPPEWSLFFLPLCLYKQSLHQLYWPFNNVNKIVSFLCVKTFSNFPNLELNPSSYLWSMSPSMIWLSPTSPVFSLLPPFPLVCLSLFLLTQLYGPSFCTRISQAQLWPGAFTLGFVFVFSCSGNLLWNPFFRFQYKYSLLQNTRC